ncbi:MAG: hypothetical protein KAR40_14305 [Candidatus Sabulitectum sp.]|nr:hypothetical protein [Candidatus Sabulitectum sp.]
MTNSEQLTPRQELLLKIKEHNNGREIRTPRGIRWGELILPAKDETLNKNAEGLKVLAICSWTLGFLAFETLKLIERRLPGELNIVGLVTDDPTDGNAKISKKRRFWRYYDSNQQEEFERGIIESALTFGIPCYTGEVKNEFFRNLLKKWNPDLVVVSAFGQIIDTPIIDYPAYGIYNVHPADLLHHFGAGPQPWEDLVARKAETTRVTIHKVSTTIDSGDIVGQSSPINVRLKNNIFTDNVRLVGEKTLLPVDHMVAELVCQIILRRKAGMVGPLNKIDFERLFSQKFKDKLMESIDPASRGHLLPLPAEDIKFTV